MEAKEKIKYTRMILIKNTGSDAGSHQSLSGNIKIWRYNK